ncbi:MAG: DNA polymerase III subunit gamma/tau C-terminal domain-containing protein, partial [Limnohabitans sp.]
VDEIQQLLEQAVYKPVQGRFKVFMIDEVHMLTGHAFNAMLKTLEEPPEYLKFVLATTDPHKVPVTVLSRCLQFNLRPMASQTIVEHLQQVMRAEQMDCDVQALRLIARAARGSMRDALSLTDQAIAFGNGKLIENFVRDMLGSVDRTHVFTLLQALANTDGLAVVTTCEDMRQLGMSASSLLEEMCLVLQRMAVQQTVPAASDSFCDPDPDAFRIAELAALMPADETQLLYSMCLHGRTELGLASDEFAALTMVLLRLFAFKPAAESTEKKTLKSADIASSEVASPVKAHRAAAGSMTGKNVSLAAAPPMQHALTSEDQALSEAWFSVVETLVADQKIQAVTRELAMQSQWIRRDGDRWILQVERESLVSAANLERLQNALRGAGHQVDLVTQIGTVNDSPAIRRAQKQAQNLTAVEEEILNDPVVQQLIREFDAKIVPGSIKTSTH